MDALDEEALQILIAVLQDQAPLTAVDPVFMPIVDCHMDQYRFKTSASGWKEWVRFLREKGRVSEMSGVCTAARLNKDGTLTIKGYWTGKRHGRSVVSGPISATYRLENGQIAELWTERKNYAFFFPILRYRYGLEIIFVYLFLWKRLRYFNDLPKSYAAYKRVAKG